MYTQHITSYCIKLPCTLPINRKWLMERFYTVDEALCYVRPPDMDASLARCSDASISLIESHRGTKNLSTESFQNFGSLYKYAGRIYMARAQFVLQRMFADIELPTNVWRTLLNEMKPIIVLMNLCKCMTHRTVAGQIKFFCGELNCFSTTESYQHFFELNTFFRHPTYF